MPDTNISWRQDMQKEAAHKFHSGQTDLFGSSGAVIISDTEGNHTGVHGKNSLIGYGHAMGIVTEI